MKESKCDICEKVFKTKSSLKYHYNQHHNYLRHPWPKSDPGKPDTNCRAVRSLKKLLLKSCSPAVTFPVIIQNNHYIHNCPDILT